MIGRLFDRLLIWLELRLAYHHARREARRQYRRTRAAMAEFDAELEAMRREYEAEQ